MTARDQPEPRHSEIDPSLCDCPDGYPSYGVGKYKHLPSCRYGVIEDWLDAAPAPEAAGLREAAEWLVNIHADSIAIERGSALWEDLQSLRAALAATPPQPDPQDRWRLVRVATDMLSQFGTRTETGDRITAEWGQPDEFGIYEPIFTVHAASPQPDRAELDVERLARAVCPDGPDRLGPDDECRDFARRLAAEYARLAADTEGREP